MDDRQCFWNEACTDSHAVARAVLARVCHVGMRALRLSDLDTAVGRRRRELLDAMRSCAAMDVARSWPPAVGHRLRGVLDGEVCGAPEESAHAGILHFVGA